MAEPVAERVAEPMALADSGRPQLPRNADAPIPSPADGVAPVAVTKRVPIYPAVLRVGAQPWSFAGLEDDVFTSPYHVRLRNGYLSRTVRAAMDLHPKVRQAYDNLREAIVGDGGRCIPCVAPSHPDFAEAKRVAEFCDYALRHQCGDHADVIYQMTEAIRDGEKVADIALKDVTMGRWKGMRIVDRISILPERNYAFFKDASGETTYLEVLTAGTERAFYPRQKFWVYTWRGRNRNPHGFMQYAAAYTAWYRDTKVDSEEMAYIAQVGRPSVVIIAAPPPDTFQETAIPLRTADGKYLYEPNPDYDPTLATTADPLTPDDPSPNPLSRIRYGYQVEQNSIVFLSFKAGSVWSLEHGSEVEVKQAAAGGADLFRFIRDANARQIAAAIYGTHQVTEAERQVSTSNAEIGEGVAGLNVNYGKMRLERTEEDDILSLLVEHNFGPAYLDLLPIRDYGSTMNSRMPRLFNSVVGMLTNGAMTRDQWFWFCAGNGLPLPYLSGAGPAVATPKLTGGGDKTGGGGAGGDSGDSTDSKPGGGGGADSGNSK